MKKWSINWKMEENTQKPYVEIMKRYFRDLLCVGIILLISLAMASLVQTEILLIGFLFISTIFFCVKRDSSTFNYFLIYTIFQNLFLILCARGMTSRDTILIILIKEFIVYFGVVFYFITIKKRSINFIEMITIFFGIVSIINILFISESFKYSAISLRQITIIFSCYYFGKILKIKSGEYRDLMNCILFWCIFVCVIGLGLYFFTSDKEWLSMGYGEYWANKTGGASKNQFTNFYSWDFGIKLKRMFSIFMDPLACSHFLSISLVLLVVSYKKVRWFLLPVVFVSVILGISKASLVLAAVMIVMFIYLKIENKRIKRIFIGSCIGVVAGILVFLFYYTNNVSQPTAISNHADSLFYGIRNMSLFGNGLGTSGYNATMMGLKNFDKAYNESFFALCVGQMGIFGVVPIYLFMGGISIKNFLIYQSTKNEFVLASVILVITTLIESFVSASSISMLGTGLYFVIAGVCSNTVLSEEL